MIILNLAINYSLHSYFFRSRTQQIPIFFKFFQKNRIIKFQNRIWYFRCISQFLSLHQYKILLGQTIINNNPLLSYQFHNSSKLELFFLLSMSFFSLIILQYKLPPFLIERLIVILNKMCHFNLIFPHFYHIINLMFANNLF